LRERLARCRADARESGERDSGKLIACLDVAAGVEIEGIAPPQLDAEDHAALRAWNLLGNGMGGIDWAGLPYVAAWLGITNVDGLMQRLSVIKHHKPPKE
jgi:hypothetical protein